MSTDPFDSPALQSGYSADEGSPVPPKGPPIKTAALSAKDNRGKRAPQTGSGVVVGSGAGAGGGGGAEDFDSDAAGGGGALPTPEDDHPAHDADAPVGGSR